MVVEFVTNEKVAETSSKGNQEKWYNRDNNRWYKIDQFGYEALAETLISRLLEKSNIAVETPFTFAKYEMVRINVHGRERTGCSSVNFLHEGQSIITLSHLFNRYLDSSLKSKLEKMSSDKKRIAYLADATKEFTELDAFPQYLTLLFEIDSLFLNDDRHLNNIAVIEKEGRFDYCPIFDNGAGLLSNIQFSPMDIEPKALVKELFARPFNISFNRQMNSIRALYGKQLKIPKLSETLIKTELKSLLNYYAERDRDLISDRVVHCILSRQKML